MAIELGSAYVTVIPEMNGVQASIGKALGDKSMGNKAGGLIGDGMSMGIASKLKTIAKLIAGLAATKAIIDFGRAALDSYAQYEQLVGGVDTLFKDASSQVQQFAADAYQTAGMSANQYMETVTGFSASLIQSLDGDTARAAQLADQAIRDMSDNANKMGTDMESIQNAYQGFAKQNYTMLDNLKLGYGGTKEEMERLLADAEAISGVHYDISSYADVVDAIHVIQTEMDITGTTAREAASTIEGSVGMMKAAWANWVTGIADEDADMGELSRRLVESVVTAAKNVVPRIGVIARQMASEVPGLLLEAMRAVPDLLGDLFGEGGEAAILGFVGPLLRIPDYFAPVAEKAGEALGALKEAASPLLGALSDLGGALESAFGRTVTFLITSVSDALGNLFDGAGPGIESMSGAFSEAAETVGGWADAVKGFLDDGGIRETVGGALDWLSARFSAVRDAVVPAFEGMVERVKGHMEDFSQSFDDVKGALGRFADAFGYLFDQAAPVVTEIAGYVISAFVGLGPIIASVATVVVDLASAVMTALGGAIQFIVWAFTEGIPAAVDFLGAKWEELKAWGTSLASDLSVKWEGIKSKVSSTVDNMRSAVASKFNAIKNSVSGVVNGIKTTVSNAFNAVKTAMTTPIESAKTAISSAISSISSIVSGVKLSLPHFPLPHFRVSGGSAPWGIGGAGSPPSFGVDWYARGGFFSEPTVFLPGVGERGTELAWPSYEPYFSKYAQGIADAMPGQGQEAVVAWLDRNLGPVIHANVDHLSRRDFNRMAREAVRAGA